MKKYFIFSDIHSFYDLWQEALKNAGFDINNSDHILISLGDLLDRGDKPLECLNFINSVPKDRKILIKGNHEDLMEEAIERGYFELHDDWNRTVETVFDLVCTDNVLSDAEALNNLKKFEPWTTYVDSCIDYYELDNNVFVHGWLPSFVTWKDSIKVNKHWRNGNWKKARWLNGMEQWAIGNRLNGTTIWCGHYHTSWGHANLHNDGKEFLSKIETYYIDPETGKTEPHENFDPFIDEGIVAIDACTAHSHKVNVLTLEI